MTNSIILFVCLIDCGVIIIVLCFLLDSSDLEGPMEYCKNYSQQLDEPLNPIQNINESNETEGNE